MDRKTNIWKEILVDWRKIKLNVSDIIIHSGLYTFSVPFGSIDQKALKYYDHYKSKFIKTLEFKEDIHKAYNEEYFDYLRDFRYKNSTDGYSYKVKKIELIFQDNDVGPKTNISSSTTNPFSNKKEVVFNTSVSYFFNWTDFIRKLNTPESYLIDDGHELLANVVGKAYFLSYLNKQIQASESKEVSGGGKKPTDYKSLLSYFKDVAENKEKFLSFLLSRKYLKLVDEKESNRKYNYNYDEGRFTHVDFAMIFVALHDLRDIYNKPIVKTYYSAAALVKLLNSEFGISKKQEGTFSKLFSPRGERGVDREGLEYKEKKALLEKIFNTISNTK